jgi:predicted aspartyl protease
MRRIPFCIATASLLYACSKPAPPAVASSSPSPDLGMHLLSDGAYVAVDLGNGLSGLFLVDTGAHRCFVTARGMRLVKDGFAKRGKREERMVEGASIDGYPVGEIKFSTAYERLAQFEPLADGILGLDFLSRYTVGIDFQRGVLRLWPRGANAAKASRAWLQALGKPVSETRLHPFNGLYLTRAKLDGHDISAIIDTGSPDAVVNARDAHKWGWKNSPRQVEGGFYYGGVTMDEYTVHKIQLGPFTVTGPYPVHVPRNDAPENLVGRDALAHTALLFDFPGQKLLLAPLGASIGAKRPATGLRVPE